jgi:uncharacterized protein
MDAITVRVCKYDGSEHRRWPATVRRHEGSLLVLDAKFEDEIRHEQLGTINKGTISVEYYWLDRWYNVFRFTNPTSKRTIWYCNVNMPPVFDGKTLTYVDLDIDVLVEPSLLYRVLDFEEFEQNSARFSYSREARLNAQKALGEIIALIESRAFPFNE